MKNALILFVKYPQAGKVKTRLAQSVGFEKAAQLYKELVETNVAEIRSLSADICDCWIFYDPSGCEPLMRQWLGNDFSYFAQQGEGLTQRLTHAMGQMFDQKYNAVAILGSDTQSLSRDLIIQTFDQLKTCDVVLGPAQDGGYYLIGLSQFLPEIFEGIPWSTSSVLNKTMERVQELKRKCFLLKKLSDLDEISDLPAKRSAETL